MKDTRPMNTQEKVDYYNRKARAEAQRRADLSGVPYLLHKEGPWLMVSSTGEAKRHGWTGELIEPQERG